MSLSPEQTGRVVGQGTTVPFLEARFTSHEPNQINLGHGATLNTSRAGDQRPTPPSYEYRQWVQSQKYDQDTAPRMPTVQDGNRSRGSYGYWEKLKTENGADPTPLSGQGSLASAEEAVSLDQRYNDIVFSIGESEDTPAIIMRKIMSGASDLDVEALAANSAASFGLMQAIYPHPKQRPDYQAATVTAREKALVERLKELKGIDPNLAYRASYVGKDPQGFRTSLKQLKENYGIKRHRLHPRRGSQIRRGLLCPRTREPRSGADRRVVIPRSSREDGDRG